MEKYRGSQPLSDDEARDLRSKHSDTFSIKPLYVHPHSLYGLDALGKYVLNDLKIIPWNIQAQIVSAAYENCSMTEQVGGIGRN